jgi:hypothetical protein
MATAREVAEFMVKELELQTYLYQETVVYRIMETFGEGFTGSNTNGNPCINPDVLKEFNKLTPNVVWDRSSRYWRIREPYDKPGRQQ